MKKQIGLLALLFFVLLSFSFRNVSVFGIDEHPIISVDEHLLGKWQLLEDTDRLGFFTIGKQNNFQYKISYKTGIGSIKELSQNTAFVSELNNIKFINIFYIKDKLRGYLLFKLSELDTVNNKFSVSMVIDSSIEQIDNRDEVRELISNNLNNTNFFSKEFHLQKIDSLVH